MDINTVLQELGLSEGEIKTYLALLKLGSSPVSKIKEETNLHRTTVYDFLEKLINKALVNYVMKEGIKCYKASDPGNLMNFLKEKEDKLKEIMPELKKLSDFHKEELDVEVYKGKEGFKNTLNKIVEIGKDMYGFGFDESKYETLDPIMMKQYFRKTKEKGIMENIFVKKSSEFLYNDENVNYFFLPDNFFNPNPTMTFGDYVVIQIWNPFTSIVIKNKDLADSYKKYFDFLRTQTSMIFKGWEEVKIIYEDMLKEVKDKGEILTYGCPPIVDNDIYINFFKEQNHILKKRNIRYRITFDERCVKNIKGCKKEGYTVRIIKKELSTPMEVSIYGDKSFMVIWKEDPKEVTAIVFNDKDITASFKQYGEMLWSIAKPA